MEKFSISFILFCLLSINGIGQEYPIKPEPAVYVNDFANVFDPQQKSQLEAILIDYFDSTSTQIVVVTINSLQGMDAAQYATELGEKWGVGQGTKDNGVLFLIAPKDRAMFIASGRGTEEKLTDVFLGRIRDQYILPEFKKQNYYNGVYLGVMQIMNRLSGSFQSEEEPSQEISLSVLIFIILLMFTGFWLLAKFSRNTNYGETFSGKGYKSGGFWGGGNTWDGGSSWGSSSWGGGSSGGSFGGGSFGGGGAGGSW